jgi:Fic family protein
MRRISQYIHQNPTWPSLQWQSEKLIHLLSAVRHKQGKIIGRMESLGFNLRNEATLHMLALDVLKSSEIEGEILDADQVRSSIARRLGMDIAGLVQADRNVEGIVEMMMDATQNYQAPLSKSRLFFWHAAMFPGGRSGMQKIRVGSWRDNPTTDPMQVVSGPMGKEKIHFEAPPSEKLEKEMSVFLEWFNQKSDIDSVMKAGVAHFWFVTIHPFDDGNGRIARAIADLQLARSDQSKQRFYSMSAQIRKERKEYYDILEKSQKGTLDITQWLEWFLSCLDRALAATDETLSGVLNKARFWETHHGQPFNDRQRLMINKLMDSFDGKLSSSKWAKMTKTSQDSALRDIQDLVSRGILTKDPAGGRSTNYFLSN